MGLTTKRKWEVFLKIIKNFKMVTAQREINRGEKAGHVALGDCAAHVLIKPACRGQPSNEMGGQEGELSYDRNFYRWQE